MFKLKVISSVCFTFMTIEFIFDYIAGMTDDYFLEEYNILKKI